MHEMTDEPMRFAMSVGQKGFPGTQRCIYNMMSGGMTGDTAFVAAGLEVFCFKFSSPDSSPSLVLLLSRWSVSRSLCCSAVS